MSNTDLTPEQHAEKMVRIIQKGGSIFCHRDDEHLFLNRGIPYTVDKHGVIEKGSFIACGDNNLAPDLDVMVKASLDGLQAIAEGDTEISWSGPY